MASILDYAKNVGSNIMGGANVLADRASNIFLNQVPNRYIDYRTGRTDPVTDIREIAPTRSTQDILTQGITSNIERKGYDFSKPFSSVVQATGGGGQYGLGRTVDYGGHKLGNPLKAGIAGFTKELGPYWNMLGGSAENQIANILGDYTVNYTPKLDPNHPEVMNIYDEYDFLGKSGEGSGSPYDINVNLSPQMIEKIKRSHMIRRKKMMKDRRATQKGIAQAAMQKKIKQAQDAGGTGGAQQTLQAQITAQANREARERVGRGEARDYGHTQTRSSSGWRSDPMWKGGRAGFQAGGIVDLYRHGGF